MRKRVITALTFGAIVSAFVLFGILKSIDSAFKDVASTALKSRLYVTNRASLMETLPFKYGQEISRINGVRSVSHSLYFDSYYQDEKQGVMVFAIDPVLDFGMYPEERVEAAYLSEMVTRRDGAIVGLSLLKRFGWKIGDKVPLNLGGSRDKDGSEDYTFLIVGSYDVPQGEMPDDAVYINYDYINERKVNQRDQVGLFVVALADDAVMDEVASKIDAVFANSPFETRTQNERAFFQGIAKQIANIGAAVSFIIAAVFFTMLLLTGTTMIQCYRSRISELAMLKALGFPDVTVMSLLLAESATLCISGAVVGLFLASGLGSLTTRMLPQLANITGAIHVSPGIFFAGLLLALTMALMTGAVPAIMAKRLNIVDALKVR